LRTLIRRSSEQQKLDLELWGRLFAVSWLCRGRRCLFLARLQGWISSSDSQRFVLRHLYCWTLEMIQLSGLRFNRECLLLKNNFSVFIISVNVSLLCMYMYLYVFGKKHIV
jgi:hypothetical protein